MKMPFFTLFLAIILTGCGSIADKDVIGEYDARYTFAREQLSLKTDHTYEQRIRANGSTTPLLREGNWSFLDNHSIVNLQDPLIIDDNLGKLRADYQIPVNGLWGLRAERGLLGISLNWNDDGGVRFVRQ